MFWPKLYLVILLALSVGGFIFDSKNTRTAPEFAVNILTVAAPALLVLAYIIPGLFQYKISILALFGITIVSNWLSGRMYLQEMNEDMPHEAEMNSWSMAMGVILMLAPAFWFGLLAYTRG